MYTGAVSLPARLHAVNPSFAYTITLPITLPGRMRAKSSMSVFAAMLSRIVFILGFSRSMTELDSITVSRLRVPGAVQIA